MPNYFYVRDDGGSNVGTLTINDDTSFTSIQNGSFPANSSCYPSLADAVQAGTKTNPATHGDIVFVADDHQHNYAAYLGILGPESAGSGVTIISVDVTDCDAYKAGAKETANNNVDTAIDGVVTTIGMTFEPGDDHNVISTSNTRYVGCTFTSLAAADRPLSIQTDQYVAFYDCTINFNHIDSGEVILSGHGFVEFIGCTFATSASYADSVFTMNATDTMQMSCVGCDFSGLSSTSIVLGAAWDDYANNNVNKFKFVDCALPSSLTSFASAAPVSHGMSHEYIGCASASGAAEYQYYYETGYGIVEEETTVTRDASAAFPDSNQKVSYKVISDANASVAFPFNFDLPVRYAELSTAAEDKLRIHFISETANLNDDDVFVEVIYRDGTNKHIPNTINSVGSTALEAWNPLRTASALTTNSEAWTESLTTPTSYQIDVDTSTDAGADCVPIIRVYVAKASTTIYFCSTVEVL